ncbi:MAG: methyltransferase [Verrucomicrobia bacterium]|nr:methyltransferase [Verrucomicrobiota bacterium]
MRRAIIRIVAPFLQRFSKVYFSKPRKYNHKGINGIVLPNVFQPHFTWSTALLMEYIEQHDLKDKNALELGCGTGILSAYMAKKGANVLATDINPSAIENAQLNAKRNGVEVNTLLSDLFTNIPKISFDFILINPPYYPKNPVNMAENAWYCGAEFEYFKRLFKEVSPYFINETSVFIILSEDCDITQIKGLAEKQGWTLREVYKKRKMGEQNFIYRLECI